MALCRDFSYSLVRHSAHALRARKAVVSPLRHAQHNASRINRGTSITRRVDLGTHRPSHMTRLLDEAFAAAAALPEAEQNALASALLSELASEQAIDAAIAARPDVLARLSDEAMAEHRAGRTEALDPDTL